MNVLDPRTMPLEGTSLIEASAGTGKTYTLTTLYLRLLIEEGLRPADILVVTYTNAATAQLKERVRERLRETIEAVDRAEAGESKAEDKSEGVDDFLLDQARLAGAKAAEAGRPDPLRQALASFDEAAIFTIHGFCQRTLKENAFESGLAFDAELVEQSRSIEQTLAHDLFQRLLIGEPPSFVSWLLEGTGKRWQWEPSALESQLLRVLGADEEMPIVPACPNFEGGASWAAAENRAADALRDWAASWSDRRAAVCEILLGENDLKGGSYKPATIESKWLPALDLLRVRIEDRRDDDTLVSIELPDCFGKLTTAAMIPGKGTKKGGEAPVDACFDAFGEVLEALAIFDAYREERALWLRHRFVDCAREEAHRRRTEQHVLFFDDLLSELRRALRAEGGERLAEALRDRYRFALIDEFQDTDPVQYDVFRQVWHEGTTNHRRGLVLIGDPKQAIYSFRGADVFTYLSARSDAGEAAYGLAVNWRSDPSLIEGVNAIFGNRAEAFQIEAIAFDPVAPRPGFEPIFDAAGRSAAGLRVLMAERDAMSAATGETRKPDAVVPARYGRTWLMRAVAGDIADLLNSGATIEGERVVPSDIAILCRRKSELSQARRALKALGIPCVDRGDADVFESREAWEFGCVLRAMMRPTDPATLRGALSSGAHGLNAGALETLTDESSELASISERFAEYGRLWSKQGFSRAIETWRRREGVTERLLAYDDGERRLTNWLHLAELLQRIASERSPSRAGLVASLERAIASAEARALFSGEASLLRLERDDQAISLVTLHRSKGLEYGIVYLPSLWEDHKPMGASAKTADEGTKRNPPVRFHDEGSGRRSLDLAGHAAYGEHLTQSEDENFAEQLRLLYVGLTRARHQCVVAWGAIGDPSYKAPLAWLLHGEDGVGLSREDSAKLRKKWTDEEWRAAWATVAERAGPDAVEVVAANFDPRPLWTANAPAKTSPQLAFAAPSRRLSLSVRTTSFSALTREGHRQAAPSAGPEAMGRDLDVHVSEGASHHAGDEREVEADLAMEMHAFPRGADAGTLLHGVLENVDFHGYAAGDAREEAVRASARSLLAKNNMDTAHVPQVVHVVSSVARTPIPLGGPPGGSPGTPLENGSETFRLADVAEKQLLPEMEFTLATPSANSGRCFDPEALSGLLATAPAGSPLERYADRAGRMGFRALNGYLRGFIDALFQYEGRYYVVDYKSNHLGSRQADYFPDALVDPMIHHDYILQYLVYTIAVDRHLARCIPDYDYDTHFGGAYYLFLRGMAEAHPLGCGVFFDRPAREIVTAAGALMGLDSAEGVHV